MSRSPALGPRLAAGQGRAWVLPGGAPRRCPPGGACTPAPALPAPGGAAAGRKAPAPLSAAPRASPERAGQELPAGDGCGHS